MAEERNFIEEVKQLVTSQRGLIKELEQELANAKQQLVDLAAAIAPVGGKKRGRPAGAKTKTRRPRKPAPAATQE